METAEIRVRNKCPEVTMVCDEEVFRIYETISGLPKGDVIGEGETAEKAWENAAASLGLAPDPDSHLRRVNLH